MNSTWRFLLLSNLALVSLPALAEIKIASIGKYAINSEGLLQSDFYSYNRDVANIDGSSHDGLDTDAELRRAELIFKGAGEHWSWVLGYDAKIEKFLDTNIKYKFSNQTTVSFGQFKQANSLEELGSSRFNDFISKSMTTNLFAVGRRVGLATTTGGKKWTATGSVFGRELTRNLANGNGYGARFTYAPSNDNNGHLIHLGVSFVDYNAKDATAEGRARIRARPDADLAGTRLIDSGQFIDADRIRTAGFEAAWVNGPFKIQGERMSNRVERSAHPTFAGDSWYVYGLWNLTGENSTYKNGVLGNVAPANPARGMWQVGLRYDAADLNSGAVLGGKESNWTLGVNYYWRNNFKFSLNHVVVTSEKGLIPIQDDPAITEFRAQLYW